MFYRVPLLVVCVLLGGCMIVIGGSSPRPPRPEVQYYPEGVTPTLVMDEINAAAALDFESNRVTQLRRIAERPELTPADQVHLVYVALHRLDFESNRKAVVMNLIANPAFCVEAKSAIMRHLNRFDFDSTKSEILTTLSNRPVPAATTSPAPVRP